jgi:hypothetical protein
MIWTALYSGANGPVEIWTINVEILGILEEAIEQWLTTIGT